MSFITNYLDQLRPAICLAILACLGILLTLHYKGLINRVKAGILISLLSVVSLIQFVDYGNFIDGQNFHASEFYHYYMNGKYFGDLRYDKLYVAWATALKEINGTEVPLVRELTNKKSLQSPKEYLPLGQELKQKMGAAKWQAFKADLQQLMTYRQCNWNVALGDAGYNASPSWALESQLVTRGPPNPAVLTKIDALLVILSIILLGTTFGWIPTLAGFIVMTCLPAGWLNDYNWTGGSLLRFSWVFFLTIGLVCYQRKWHFIAGTALGIATLERLFPGGFLAAIGLYQFIRSLQEEKFNIWFAIKKTMPLIAGATTAAVVIIGLSAALWPGCWQEFLSHIFRHKDLMFTNAFGWAKACSFYPGMEQIQFSQSNDSIFQGMSDYLQTRSHLLGFTILKFASFLFILASLIRTRAIAAAVLAGFATIYFFSIPAQYYLTMLLPITAVAIYAFKDSLFPASYCLVILIGSLLEQVSDITGFALLSIWFYLALMFIAGYHLTTKCQWLSGLLSSSIAGGLFLLLAAPLTGAIPPAKYPTAMVAQTDMPINSTQRIYPDPYGSVILDYGKALKPGIPCVIKNPQPNAHKNCLLIIRTDRFFQGVLTVSAQQTTLAKTAVSSRGYLYDYIVLPISWYPEYSLSWQGGDNIGIFQCWVN